jgi:hypothetical protein
MVSSAFLISPLVIASAICAAIQVPGSVETEVSPTKRDMALRDIYPVPSISSTSKAESAVHAKTAQPDIVMEVVREGPGGVVEKKSLSVGELDTRKNTPIQPNPDCVSRLLLPNRTELL